MTTLCASTNATAHGLREIQHVQPADSSHFQTTNFDSEVRLGFAHRVRFTRDAFDPANPALREVFAGDRDIATRRAVAFIDAGLMQATDAEIAERLRAAFVAGGRAMPQLVEIVAVPGGESAKENHEIPDIVLQLVNHHRICRKSFVIAIGGGAMLDAVGYGAAISHRGVRLVRMPSTVLAQDDAAMGVKNGINRFGKKNFVGVFAVPYAVLCDELLLETLPDPVFRAGFSEAVKIALLKDPAYFARLERDAAAIATRDPDASNAAIRRSAELHLSHIVDGGDPFEASEARPLDFGHWAAHRLESMSGFAVSHGDAVALGLLLDCRYSNLKGWLSDADHARIRAVIAALGLPMRHPLFADHAALLAGADEFREHLGGQLTVTMLRGVGHGFEVHELDHALVQQAARELA